MITVKININKPVVILVAEIKSITIEKKIYISFELNFLEKYKFNNEQ